MKAKNRLVLKIVCIVVAIFVVFNIFWFAYREIRFSQFTNGFEVMAKGEDPEKTQDGVWYNVYKPTYLSFKGNLTASVRGEKYISKSGREFDISDQDGLIIWPKFPFNYSYAVDLELYHYYDEQANKEVSESFVVLIDENGEWIDKSDVFSKEQRDLFKQRQEFIKEFLKDTKEFWNIH